MNFDIVRRYLPPHSARERARLFVVTYRRWLVGFAGAIVLLAAVYSVCFAPPKDFPVNSIITIPKGLSAQSYGETLADAQVIRFPFVFRILARATGYDHHLDPGAYVFKEPVSLGTVLLRTGNAQHGIEAVRVTLTEGMTSFDMARVLKEELPGFDEQEFLQQASTSEGYLFPDTYLFMPGTTPEEIVLRLKSEFSQKISSITPQIMAFRHSFSDAVIMASILEREAQSEEDKRMVAGILWNRIEKGMRLQVDAAFGYAVKQNGYTPTASDLASDSPYNTYRNNGLPPTPISNPGIESLLAAVTPSKTDYLYYLTGLDGKMYYAVTFEGHKKNRALYLDK